MVDEVQQAAPGAVLESFFSNLEFWAVGALGVVVGIFLTVLVLRPAVMVTVSSLFGVLLIAAGTGLSVTGVTWMVDGSSEPGFLAGYSMNARVCIGAGAAGLVGGIAAIVVTFFKAARPS